jgi:hypothetical protein
VKYLGRSGVATVGGLLVAFLDGQYNAAAFKAGDAAGASSTAPGCRYYVQSGGCARPAARLAGRERAGTCCCPPLLARRCLYLPLHVIPPPIGWIARMPALPPCPTPPADVDRLKLQLTQAEGDMDVLLTCEWPAGLCDGLLEAAKPVGIPLDGAWAATATGYDSPQVPVRGAGSSSCPDGGCCWQGTPVTA